VLPLYELALQTSAHLRARDIRAMLTLITPEGAPLESFGPAGTEQVESLLRERGVALMTGTYVAALAHRDLLLVPAGRLTADRVVTLPRVEGPGIEGLPDAGNGFLPVDLHGRVHGVEDVYAAGDATASPVKQGGLAAQQADAVAEAIAARVGALVRPRPFRPVLRGALLTGGELQYLRHELSGGRGETSAAAAEPLWWPPAKIAGRHLAPYLAQLTHAGSRVTC
jgi:sulfide:quinone oxidoreductase